LGVEYENIGTGIEMEEWLEMDFIQAFVFGVTGINENSAAMFKSKGISPARMG
jgi:hypothetical protein